MERGTTIECGRTEWEWFRIARDRFGLYQKENEILPFLRFARRAAPVAACEIGTWKCGTTLLLANLLPSLAVLVGVDRLVQNERELRASVPGRLELRLIEGVSAGPETVRRVARALGPRPLDLLLLDADHTYEAVRADFLAYRGLVREGGMVAFHDIVRDYRSRFGAEDGPWGGDVPHFWTKVKRRGRVVEFVENPDQNAYGIGVIVVGGERGNRAGR